jgi:hypothetical protein
MSGAIHLRPQYPFVALIQKTLPLYVQQTTSIHYVRITHILYEVAECTACGKIHHCLVLDTTVMIT